MGFEPGNKYGGAKPNSGRPKDEVKQLFQDMLRESGAHERFAEILKNEKNKETFLKAYQVCLDRGYGKVAQPMDLSGDITVGMSEMILAARKKRNLD